MDEDLISDLKNKQIVHWNARNLFELPLELFQHGSRTEEIYLRWNNIHALPSWMGCALTSLTNLYLEFNKLNNLPEELIYLKNLETLHLCNNNFCSIPKQLLRLTNLKNLKMSRNLIDLLPAEIGGLRSLEVLDLSYNMLKILPREIAACVNLREIYLNNNNILFLPRVMTQMTKLEMLCIASNLLHFLPATPFISRPVINVSFNNKLNWCSLQAVNQNLSNVDYTSPSIDTQDRCRNWIIQQAIDGRQFIETNCGGATQILHLPCGLEIVNTNETKLPTLLELAQRCTSNICSKDRGVAETTTAFSVHMKCVLPSGIQKNLNQGPTALCAVCSSAIFCHSFCSLIHSNIVQIPHCLLIFCSRTCALNYYSQQNDG